MKKEKERKRFINMQNKRTLGLNIIKKNESREKKQKVKRKKSEIERIEVANHYGREERKRKEKRKERIHNRRRE